MNLAVRRPRATTQALAIVAVAVVIGLPVFGLLEGWLRDPGDVTRQAVGPAWGYLWNSIVLSVSVALTAGTLGAWLGWSAQRLAYPLSTTLRWVALMPLATPSYLLAAATERVLFSPGAWLEGWRGLPAAWLVLSVVTTPVVQIVVSTAVARAPGQVEAAARSLGASRWRLWRAVVFPRIRAGVAFGFVLAFVYAISDFGAVAVLDAPVLTFRLYQAVAAHELGRATFLGLLLVGAAAPMLVLAGWLRGGGVTTAGSAYEAGRVSAHRWETSALWVVQGSLGALGVGLPLVEMMRWVWEGARAHGVTFAPVWEPFVQTLALSGVAAAVTVGLAALPSWVVGRGRFAVLRHAVWGASALPGPLVAFGWILASLFVSRTMGWSYGVILGSGVVLFLGYATRFLAEAAAPLEEGVVHLDARHEAAARTLGASRWRWARAIVLPSLRSSIFAAYLLVFVAILKELPVTLLLGGPVGVRTLAFRVFDRYNEALFHDAGLAGLLLMAVTLSAFVLTIRWQR